MKPIDQFINGTCDHCEYGVLIEMNNDWWLKCNDCGALKFCYTPLPHQEQFHADPSKYKMFAGGYGSGKTTTTVAEVIRHVLETPGGTTLMGAATLPQLEQTSMKEFFSMMPEELIENRSVQKNFVDIVNGHRVIFRPLDDEGKARSLNLTCFHIEEASEVGYEYFVQLQTRLRNTASKDHMGLISTNPDNSWVKDEFLLKSGKILNADRNYPQDKRDINSSFSTHIAPTRLNTYLPPTFYADTARGKPDFWVKRYLEGSFQYAEGSVYPMFPDHVIEPFDIITRIKEQGWEVLPGADWGLRDPTVMLLAAIDQREGICYIFDEHYEANQPVSYHAKKMQELLAPIPHGLLRQAVGDPSGKKRNNKDMRTLFDHYMEYGLYFKPGSNAIDAGIQKVYTYFHLGRLKIFSSCINTVKEGLKYKYKPAGLDDKVNMDEKPIDKDNHAMDSLRYIIQELPDDPNQLQNKSYSPSYGNINNKDKHLPHALQENDSYGDSGWASYY